MMISQARVTVGWASGFLYALVANLASRTRFNVHCLNARLSRKNVMKYVMRSLNDYTNCILPRVVYAYEVTCGHGDRTFGNFDRSNFSLLECRSWEAKLRDVIIWSFASSEAPP